MAANIYYDPNTLRGEARIIPMYETQRNLLTAQPFGRSGFI